MAWMGEITRICDQKLESARERNRREHPVTAALLDEFRAVFGDGVRLVYSTLDGRLIGKVPPEPDPASVVSAGQWLKESEALGIAQRPQGESRRRK